eukprot:m.259260 g.259260  ORF g.259260 m.259260 type:complete len:77 (+) comp15552_c0_seq1:4093-4323(+)
MLRCRGGCRTAVMWLFCAASPFLQHSKFKPELELDLLVSAMFALRVFGSLLSVWWPNVVCYVSVSEVNVRQVIFAQ